jgi:hypothetical protein
MNRIHFFNSLFAVLLLAANANAIDFGNLANKAKEEAEKKAKEEAEKAKAEAEKKLKAEAEKAVIETAKKYIGNVEEPARPVSNPVAASVAPAAASVTAPAAPVAAPAVQLNSTVNLAVLETKIDAEPAVAKEFKASELRYITQEIRRQSVNNLPKQKFSVMVDSAQVQDDVTSLGEKINADFIARGIIGKFRKNYTFTVEVYDVKNGNLMLSSDPIESEKAEDLLGGFRKTAPVFFKKLEAELSSFRRAAPAVPKAALPSSSPIPVAQPSPAPAKKTGPACQSSYNVFSSCK